MSNSSKLEIETDKNVIEFPDGQLLIDAVFKFADAHHNKIIQAFTDFGIETAEEISWLTNLHVNLAMVSAGAEKGAFKIDETPNGLIKMFGLPKQLDISYHDSFTFEYEYEDITKLLPLAFARFSILIAKDMVEKSDYDEFIGLLSASIFAYDTYNVSKTTRTRTITQEIFDNVKSIQAKINAHKRHKENYELKKDALKYWEENISPSVSNDEAATLLLKIIPLTHRKLSEYVSEAKRSKIPPASKV